MTPIETIERLLQSTLGRRTYVDEADGPFHPDALAFYNEEPREAFEGVTDKPLFETNLLLGEMDDDRKYRLERKGDVLIYTRFERSSGAGTFHATGQAIVCPQGSNAEAVFTANALADAMEAASEPLRCAMTHMREAGLSLSHGFATKLREDIFGKDAA